MERRTASNTEEEELNQRRRLLNLAKKGDPKAINRLFELYQVRVYSGEYLSKAGRLPAWPSVHQKPGKVHQKSRKSPVRKRVTTRAALSSRRAAVRKSRRKATR
jgi:hypothetical protein